MPRTRTWRAALSLHGKPVVEEFTTIDNKHQGTYFFPGISTTTAKIVAQALNMAYSGGYSEGWDEGQKYNAP